MYTHYFKELVCTPHLADAARILIENSDAPIAGPDGEGEPIIDDEAISFNGVPGNGGETFYLDSDTHPGNGWCKTYRNSYDEVVGALLAYAILSASPGWESISSDGELQEEEWFRAVSLYERCFGRLGEEEFQLLLSRIGRPIVRDEESGEYVEWDGHMDRDNYEEIVELFAR